MNQQKQKQTNERNTNIHIAADDQGISISGLTNIEYLHVLHAIRKFLENQTDSKNETIQQFNSDIKYTLLTILRKGAIVYSDNE
jgi:hypothetical protein